MKKEGKDEKTVLTGHEDMYRARVNLLQDT